MALSGKLDEVGEADRWIWERLGRIWERLGCWTGSSQQPRRLIKTQILLAENLLEQGGGGFGEGELAEAGIHGNGVGAGDLVEGIVLHFSSFHAARRFVCWFMLRAEPFFCCGFIVGIPLM